MSFAYYCFVKFGQATTQQDQAAAVAAAANASNLMGMDKRQLALLFPPKNEQSQQLQLNQGNSNKQTSAHSGASSSSNMADVVNQQELAFLSKYAAGKLQPCRFPFLALQVLVLHIYYSMKLCQQVESLKTDDGSV